MVKLIWWVISVLAFAGVALAVIGALAAVAFDYGWLKASAILVIPVVVVGGFLAVISWAESRRI